MRKISEIIEYYGANIFFLLFLLELQLSSFIWISVKEVSYLGFAYFNILNITLLLPFMFTSQVKYSLQKAASKVKYSLQKEATKEVDNDDETFYHDDRLKTVKKEKSYLSITQFISGILFWSISRITDFLEFNLLIYIIILISAFAVSVVINIFYYLKIRGFYVLKTYIEYRSIRFSIYAIIDTIFLLNIPNLGRVLHEIIPFLTELVYIEWLSIFAVCVYLLFLFHVILLEIRMMIWIE